jgi:1,4-alpha-glucan branching enzyme
MAKGKTKEAIKRRRVTFSFEDSGAGEVYLIGDFNDWNPTAHPMANDGNGLWKKTVMLTPEKYEYRFKVDGEWKSDPNGEVCTNCYGTENNYIVVPPFAEST